MMGNSDLSLNFHKVQSNVEFWAYSFVWTHPSRTAFFLAIYSADVQII